jgi:hypothetical protein
MTRSPKPSRSRMTRSECGVKWTLTHISGYVWYGSRIVVTLPSYVLKPAESLYSETVHVLTGLLGKNPYHVVYVGTAVLPPATYHQGSSQDEMHRVQCVPNEHL